MKRDCDTCKYSKDDSPLCYNPKKACEMMASLEKWEPRKVKPMDIKIRRKEGPIEGINIPDRGVSFRVKDIRAWITFDDTPIGKEGSQRGFTKTELQQFIECLQMIEKEMEN